MKVFAAVLIIIFVLIVAKLISGVQKAKRNGTYLQPDNLREYGVPEEAGSGEEYEAHTEQQI